jgi:hypothetical protein
LTSPVASTAQKLLPGPLLIASESVAAIATAPLIPTTLSGWVLDDTEDLAPR